MANTPSPMDMDIPVIMGITVNIKNNNKKLLLLLSRRLASVDMLQVNCIIMVTITIMEKDVIAWNIIIMDIMDIMRKDTFVPLDTITIVAEVVSIS